MDMTALRLSLQIASVSTILAIIVGVPIALLLARVRFRGRGIISALVLVPIFLPPSVMGFYLLQLVGRQSIVGSALERVFDFSLVFHWSGAVLAAFVASTPFLIRTAQAGFESVDLRYEEVARTLSD